MQHLERYYNEWFPQLEMKTLLHEVRERKVKGWLYLGCQSIGSLSQALGLILPSDFHFPDFLTSCFNFWLNKK